MMTFKKKWISILATALAFVICCTFGVVFAMDTTKAVAEEATSQYETYDELYTDDFSNNGTALTDGVFNVENDSFLTFTPSSENTSGSFIWKFQYTPIQTEGAMNIYSLSAAAWKGVEIPFNFSDKVFDFTEGKVYDVEYGVLKLKDTENEYYIYVKVDGSLKYGVNRTDGQGSGIYFYLTNGATGICSSQRPEVVVDRLINADWTIVNANTYTEDYAANTEMPIEWEVPSANSITYIDFAPSIENTTASFVWSFDFLCTATGTNFNIYLFAGGQWPQGVPFIDIAAKYGKDGFTAGEIYKIEIGMVSTDSRLNDSYRVYVTVDGEFVYDEKLVAPIKTSNNATGDGLSVYFNGKCRGVFVSEVESEVGPVPPVLVGKVYERYDVLDNADWTTYSGNTIIGKMPAEWTFKDGQFLNFTPSSRNKTGSFIWQFKYKPTVIADAHAYIYPLASCAWGAEQAIDFKDAGLEVGKEYDIEFGVVKIKNEANYYVYVRVDGEVKIKKFVTAEHGGGCSAVDCSGDDYSKHTGLYFYFIDPDKDNDEIKPSEGACIGESDGIDYSKYVDTYDELYNQNWTLTWKEVQTTKTAAMGNSWTMANGYYLDFTPTANNTTKSFIWRYTYTHAPTTDDSADDSADGSADDSADSVMNIYAFANGVWGNTSNLTYLDLNEACGFEVGETYEVELCLLKLKDSDAYEFFCVVDGVKKKSKVISATWSDGENSYAANNADGLYFYHTSAGAYGTCASNYDVACESYDVLYNTDWSIYNGSNAHESEMSSSWTVTNDKFITFTPTKENTTGSYIWRFKYKATAKDDVMFIYPLASAPWGYTAMFDFNALDIAVDTEHEVELGSLRIKNSNKYYVFVKVDGEMKFETAYALEHANVCSGIGCTGDDYSKHRGLYFYFADKNSDGNINNAATCVQDGLVVSVNGEKQTVAEGATLMEGIGASGLLPADRPCGYGVTWYDAQGNEVNGATVVTSDLTIKATYTYRYTIVDEKGNVLQSQKHTYGAVASSYSDAWTVDRTTFIGYLVDDELYYDLGDAVTASAASGSNIVARTVTLGLVDGASIRVDGTPSIRFTAIVDKSTANEATEIVNYGMLLTTKATLDTITDFTIEELAGVDDELYHNLDKANGLRYVDNPDYPNEYVYSLILDKVSIGNYGVQYVARAYAVVEYSDGTQEIIYSEFDEGAHTRSMYEVASAAIDDTEYGYTDEQKEVIQQHIDGVIYLDDSFALEGKDRNYTVEVTNNNDGTYTVKVTAKNGFDISNLGSIYVGGEKLPVYDANLSAGTFVIKEEDMSIVAINSFNTFLSAQTEERALTLNAYSGPSLGLKVNSKGEWEDSGYDFTLADLETYMAAGFDAWRLEISPYTNKLQYQKNGVVVSDIYLALDLAAQYAQKYSKPCKVYVHIPEVTGLLTDSESLAKIKNIYNELTTYDDGITKDLTGVSNVNGKNQIAGFLLKDEPKLSDATNFETMFKHLNDTCGAGAAGYDYQIALLQSYAGEENIGSSFDTYVATYAAILSGIDSIGFDSYPFGYKKVDKLIGSDTEEYTFVSEWFSLMEKYSGLDNGYTTCIQSYTAGETTTGTINKTTTYKTITKEAEISMQVYTALAYGFTNLDYFTYGDRIDYDKQVDAEIYQDVPVQWNDYSDWTKGYSLKSMYGWIKNTNAEAISLYDALGKFTNNGVQLISGTTTNNIFGEATTTNKTNAITVTSTYDMVVGGFKCGEYNGYLAVNADLPTEGNRTTSATFTLTGYTKAIVYVDGVPEVKRITDGKLTMKIGAGEGVFIVPIN